MTLLFPEAKSKTVEFKSAFNQDVIVSLVAFANAEGGDVYVGVRGDGKVVGVQLAAESEPTWINEIKSKTVPAIVPEADRIVIGKKTVVRLHFAPLPVKPTLLKGLTLLSFAAASASYSTTLNPTTRVLETYAEGDDSF